MFDTILPIQREAGFLNDDNPGTRFEIDLARPLERDAAKDLRIVRPEVNASFVEMQSMQLPQITP